MCVSLDGVPIELRGQELVSHQVKLVTARWTEILNSPPKSFTVDLDVLARMVSIEIQNCDWMKDDESAAPQAANSDHVPDRGKAGKTGTVTDEDRKRVRDYISEHRKKYSNQAPTQSAIKKGLSGKGVGSGKVKLILDEFRASGEFTTPSRSRRK